MRNKKLIILSIILIGVILITSISFIIISNSKTNETASKTNESKVKEITISNFKDKLEENGFVITDVSQKSANLIGAEEGFGYEINGEFIEIYKFNEESTEDLSKNNIKSAKSDEKIRMPTFNNMKFNVKYNKGLVLMNYEKHPNKDKVLEIFNNL